LTSIIESQLDFKEAMMTDKSDNRIQAFLQDLQERLRTICNEKGWNFADLKHRGYALQFWTAQFFCDIDPGIETDPDLAVSLSKDGGCDVFLEDPTRQHFRIIQCKASNLGKEKKTDPVESNEVNDFFNRHTLYMNRRWLREHTSENAYALLGDYADKINRGWTVELIFLTTAPASDSVFQIAEHLTEQYQKNEQPVSCKLLDRKELHQFYLHARSQDHKIPEEVEFDLPEGRYIIEENEFPFPVLIALIKGNTLRDLYSKYREGLFTHNIRDFLGKARAINRSMITTAEDEPQKFYYFNNGVSAVCTRFEIKKNSRLKAFRFQVINGAQTIGALHASTPHPDVTVLFRLTSSDKASFNEHIIRYNNTQNTINSSDFRSNDPIQQWLEREFSQHKARGPLPLLRYARKRSFKRDPGATIITLEDLAKIRYAFNHEPTLIYGTPKNLWTFQSEGGCYEQSFGYEGKIAPMWPPAEFKAALIAVAIYLKIVAETTREMQANKNQWYLLIPAPPSFPQFALPLTFPHTAGHETQRHPTAA
jgi:hypothetical protein